MVKVQTGAIRGREAVLQQNATLARRTGVSGAYAWWARGGRGGRVVVVVEVVVMVVREMVLLMGEEEKGEG